MASPFDSVRTLPGHHLEEGDDRLTSRKLYVSGPPYTNHPTLADAASPVQDSGSRGRGWRELDDCSGTGTPPFNEVSTGSVCLDHDRQHSLVAPAAPVFVLYKQPLGQDPSHSQRAGRLHKEREASGEGDVCRAGRPFRFIYY